MVRFADIVKGNSKKTIDEKPIIKEGKENKISLSDSEVLKTKTKELSKPQVIENDTKTSIAPYYKKLIKRAMDIRDSVKNHKIINASPVLSDLHHIINNNYINDCYEYAMSTPANYEDMLAHTVDVTFGSLRIGKGMGYDNKMILRLGIAAFLENVGMYRIPDSILNKKGQLEEKEFHIVKEHPKVSYEIINQMGEKYKWLAKVALQIHERSDGSGYPMGLKGEEISELASIIGLMETYIALIKNRPYREKLAQPYAIKFIIEDVKKLFPIKILKVFFNEISLFPVHTYVKLNNNSIGRVKSTIQNMPLKPTIELLFDSEKKRLKTPKIIKLSENNLLYITDIMDEKDLH